MLLWVLDAQTVRTPEHVGPRAPIVRTWHSRWTLVAFPQYCTDPRALTVIDSTFSIYLTVIAALDRLPARPAGSGYRTFPPAHILPIDSACGALNTFPINAGLRIQLRPHSYVATRLNAAVDFYGTVPRTDPRSVPGWTPDVIPQSS